MLKATPLAKAVIYEALRQSGIENEVGLRITRGNSKLMMNLDRPDRDDVVIEVNESPVIIVDSNLAAELGDLVIDINPIEEEDDLVLRR